MTTVNSLCIPRVFNNITPERVRKVFDEISIFTIDKIDMIKKENDKGDKFQRVFIHIKEWATTSDAIRAKQRLTEGKDLKIVYDEPWFWKVMINTNTYKPKNKPRIRIEFEQEEEKEKEKEDNLLRDRHIAPALPQQQQPDTLPIAPALPQQQQQQEDNRPYRQRRIDPNLCQQDMLNGFRDRRLNNKNQLMKPRVILTKEQKELKKRANMLLAAHAMNNQIIYPLNI